MKCWRCGNDVPEGRTECEPQCGGIDFRISNVQSREIDWDKVNDWQQLKRVLKALHIHIQVGTPVERDLDDLLGPPQ